MTYHATTTGMESDHCSNFWADLEYFNRHEPVAMRMPATVPNTVMVCICPVCGLHSDIEEITCLCGHDTMLAIKIMKDED